MQRKSRVVICVGHGVQFQNAFLQMFEADKDCVFMDYGAISIVEREVKQGQADEWSVKMFGDATHIQGYGMAML